MNDFTKDELQIILLDMDTYIRQNKILKESPIHKELRLKIQSMIENYCEDGCQHDWIKCFYGDEKIPINLCSLCNIRKKR